MVQHTGNDSSLTTPQGLVGESLWWSSDTRQVWEERGREKGESRENKAREKVKYLSLLSNTSALLCPAGCLDAFGAFHLTEVIDDESSSYSHLKTVTMHPALLVSWGDHWAACSCVNVCLLPQHNKGHSRYVLRDSQSHMPDVAWEPLCGCCLLCYIQNNSLYCTGEF